MLAWWVAGARLRQGKAYEPSLAIPLLQAIHVYFEGCNIHVRLHRLAEPLLVVSYL
jgi:hypothetical protein